MGASYVTVYTLCNAVIQRKEVSVLSRHWRYPEVCGTSNSSCVFACCFQYETPDPSAVRFFRGHDLSVTCVAITPDDRHVFSGSKDCSIYKCK